MWVTVLIVGCLLTLLAAGCVRLAVRRDPRVAAMPDLTEPVEAWPLSGDDDGAGPYLRGSSHAGSLSGRR